ncbi:MAG TPA: hypothetical protein PLE12_05660 [Propionicimonas sp.]|jgi:hypothetical protein|nr:hypothetical protein [Propionicimonas sp.]
MTQPPDPRWPAGPPPQQPPVLRDTAGRPLRDPLAPLGTARPDSSNIAAYAPRRSRAPWLVGVAVVVVAVLIGLGSTLGPRLWPAPTPSATPTPTPSATSGNGGGTATATPFQTSDGRVTGGWELVRSYWTDTGLQVELRVQIETGTLTATLSAFGNDDLQLAYPSTGAEYPALDLTRITAGEERVGWVFFPLDRGESTIIMSTLTRTQITALSVQG